MYQYPAVNTVFGFSGLIRFHLQRLRFPKRGSLVVDSQNLTDMRVILGKLPKTCGQESM